MSETSRNGEPVFPRRTAGNFPDDNEPQYWVQTLNEVQKQKAQEESAWVARAHCRAWRKGGAKHPDVVAQTRALSVEEQCEYLSEQLVFLGHAQREAAEKHPFPESPQRSPEQSDEEWMKACDAWEAKKGKVAGLRVKEEEKIVDARRKVVTAMLPRERLNACVEAVIEREFAKAFVDALMVETLLSAVRKEEDHREMQFTMGQEIKDLPDSGKALWAFYSDLDTVTPSEVPT